ncbi:MAG: hypothetical protein OEM42_01790 [Deltaproteobacteria bacterium]|nr:hypothetical protein [Deltaproteobacteria bacterium]MDH3382772.1 hypothetical protein [Deltaproteobacteria bacterium]
MKGERLRQKLRGWWRTADQVARAQATEKLEWEVREMENIFALLTLGAFTGLPSPPMQLTLELLPLMERELLLMLEKVDTASDPLAELFSTLNVL